MKVCSAKICSNLTKWSKITLASFSLLIVNQSVVLAQEDDPIEWSDRSSFILANNQYQNSDSDSLSPQDLLSLSESNSATTKNFTISQVPDLTFNEIASSYIPSELPHQTTNKTPTSLTLTADSSSLEVKPENETNDKKWFFTIYGGTGTNSSLGQTLTGKTSDFYDSFFNDENYIGIEVGRKIANLGNDFQIEVTGQARQHFNEADYLALETALVLRWHIARNSNFLNASLAIGDGLSYVTDLPEIEASRPNSFKKSNLLNYVLIETAFSLPKNPDWSLVLRLNHRSGVFGIFNGARDGSNNLSVGIRHSF
jgi:hypothetical protein